MYRTAIKLLLIAAAFAGTVTRASGASDELQVQKCWEYRVDDAASLITDGRAIYFAVGRTSIEAVSGDNGKKIWSSDFGGVIDSNIVLVGGNVIFVRRQVSGDGSKPGSASIQALSAATGIQRWSTAAEGDSDFRLGISGGDITAISRNGVVQLFAAADGSARSKMQLPGGPIKGTNGGNLGYIAAGESELRAVKLDRGDIDSTIKTRFEVSTIEPTDGNSIVWGDKRGNLVKYSTSSGSVVWQFKSGGTISDIVADGDRLFASSDDNFVYAVGSYNGNRLWKKRVTGRVASLLLLSDRTLVVCPLTDDNIVLLDVRTGKVAGQIALPSGETPIGTTAFGDDRVIVTAEQAIYCYSIATGEANK